ncbi:hypothetical protein [Sinosporangium siamense]|uniref:DUF4115 domain-containing protein n=1 Tax=Sinosporangium siamense TaxID=1367973 RepID=A0A919V8P7_9ACTN|nr:hypothetical protein [Sinosporangium siamense]GII94668.1 hypothetical protein Ssi02_48990 [Sinosporangium siamense]
MTLGALAVLVLVGLGARAVFWSDGPAGEDISDIATSASSTSTPTLRLECLQAECGKVLVRVPGGDILQNRTMHDGEQIDYYEPRLDVVLDDSGSVNVEVNGVPRTDGKAGQRQVFQVRRDT